MGTTVMVNQIQIGLYKFSTLLQRGTPSPSVAFPALTRELRFIFMMCHIIPNLHKTNWYA